MFYGISVNSQNDEIDSNSRCRRLLLFVGVDDDWLSRTKPQFNFTDSFSIRSKRFVDIENNQVFTCMRLQAHDMLAVWRWSKEREKKK